MHSTWAFSLNFNPNLGNTSGLIGYWDDNKELEFLLPNGTFLATNSSQARIHYEFGQQCKLFWRLILELAITETS